LKRQAQVMRELHRMQRDHRAEPVNSPAPHSLHPARITVG
jgi:hypothetical protein